MPCAWKVETRTFLSDAAVRLKNGSCKMMTLPMRRSADVLVGMDGNTHRRREGPPRKSIGDGLRFIAYASESAPTLPCRP